MAVLFVARSVARNVTADTERPASNIVSQPAVKVANGAASSANAVPHSRPKERPRSIGSQLEPLKSTSAVKRTSSIRLEDISSPRLQSSTNHSVADSGHGSKLQPTRAAPAPPDSRHRFYSSSARQPAPASAADGVPPSVSSIRTKFEPPPPAPQVHSSSQRHARRDIKNCSAVPVTSQTPARLAPHGAARPSPAVSESQC